MLKRYKKYKLFGSFPGSTHFTTNSENSSIGFVAFDNAGYSVTTLLGGTNPDFTYSDPMKLMLFPFTYNSTFTDQYSTTYSASGIPATRQSNINSVADGYSMLIMPNGQTYPDVQRFRVTGQITDVIMGMTVTTSTDGY